MKFHLPSFILGVATGASGAALAPRLRPLAVELATGCYRIFDAAMLRVARGRENVSDLLAEARARARETLRRVPLQTVEASA
ncbi:MAG: hypothetical protein H0T79_23850 [Deltaproteobacteria bacterium]|nr:hypothetical protein [Deltaproteobacteria bacterium]